MSVYFLTTKDPEGPVKIGFTDGDVMARMRQLQTGSHEPLVLTLLMPDAGRDEERALHERFSDLRLAGEWFKRDPRIVQFVESMRSEPGSVIAGAPPRASFPWGRVLVAVALFIASLLLFGGLGVVIGIGLAVGCFIRMSEPAALGFLGGLTRSRWLMLAALFSARRR